MGATLILWDLNDEGNKETARLVKELGAPVHTYTCDISQRNQVYDTADKVLHESVMTPGLACHSSKNFSIPGDDTDLKCAFEWDKWVYHCCLLGVSLKYH